MQRRGDTPLGPVGLPASLSIPLLNEDPGPEGMEVRRSFVITVGPPSEEAPEGVYFKPRGFYRLLP